MCKLFCEKKTQGCIDALNWRITKAQKRPELFTAGELERLNLTKKVFEGDVKACMRFLEKYCPEEFGRCK